MLQILPCLSLSLAGCTTLPPYGKAARSAVADSRTTFTVVMPARAPSITQGFEGDTSEDARFAHEGLDIVAAFDTPVITVAPGVVMAVTGDLLSGRRIVIDHGTDKSGTRFSTRYFHLHSQLVEIGDRVEHGQIIGSVGATGLLAPYPHLHFELHRGDGFGQAVNPHLFWLDGPGRVTCFEPTKNGQISDFRMTYPVKCKPAAEID